MAVTQAQIDKFIKHCVIDPPNDAKQPVRALQDGWAAGRFEHTIKKGETLMSITRSYMNSSAPRGFDWKCLCRFNFGVDYPPYINHKLIDKYGLDEAQNLTQDKKNYTFKGGEQLQIPLRPGASRPGSVSPNGGNVVNRPPIQITGVRGPTFMTVGIASNFGVIGYSVADQDVTKTKRDSIHWWIKNLTKGGDGEDSGKTGQDITLTITQANVTAAKYRYGDWIRMYPYFDNKNNINELICVQFKLVEVEFKHDIPRTQIDGGAIAGNDPINKIHNPAIAVIDARTPEIAAKFKLTKITTANDIPAIAPNDEGFFWKITPIKGKADFVKIRMNPQYKGSDCLVYGTEPGYVRIEGWCVAAEKYCVSKIIKAAYEREIPYRVNLLTAKNGKTTNETVASLQTVFKVQNIYLRPVGVKLVPDTDNSEGAKMNTTQDEVITQVQVPVNGTPTHLAGYFTVTNVDNQYVFTHSSADAEAASKINARPNVVNYVMMYRINNANTLGMGPTAMRNLFTQPTDPRGPAVNGMLKTHIAPDEETEWIDKDKKFDDRDIDDITKTYSLKKMQMFATPDTEPGHKNYGGILIPRPASPGPVKTAAQLTEAGATYAHELGHVVGIRHRGGDPTDEGATPDLLPSSVNNVMYWTEDGAHSPADWDLIQAEVFRGCILCSSGAVHDSLEIEAATPTDKAISGTHDSEKTFNLKVVRSLKCIVGAYLNFWIEDTRDAISIEEVTNWDKEKRKMSTGLAKVKLKFTGTTGQVAKLVIMAGDNDDLVKQEITCTVS